MLAIAAGAGIASLSMNFWIPFLPLYLQDLGATSDANALFWMAVAATGQGFARLAAGPVWGILSDRYGRKVMFLRALYFASVTTAIAAFATQPWHIVVAMTTQGLFSGFIPAATALTSVSVPDGRLNSSLSMVTGAQFVGNTLGPALGAGLAVAVGFRGAILAAAAMPALAAVLATVTVPRDRVDTSAPGDATETADATDPAATTTSATPRRVSVRSLLTAQFGLVLAVFFTSIALNQLLRVATPVALERIAGEDGAAAATGVAFTLAGLGSVGGIAMAQRFGRTGRLRRLLVVAALLGGLAHLALPFAATATAFIAVFAVIATLQAAMVPATNTLIAANAPRERRGTAFGFASGVQALAFMAGPMAAAAFAAVSLNAGFVVLAVLFLGLAGVIAAAIREPAF